MGIKKLWDSFWEYSNYHTLTHYTILTTKSSYCMTLNILICTIQIFCFNANKFSVLFKCFNCNYEQCPKLELLKQH
ncbi:hypothetical protein V1478_007753 [Vespula squamosa]|uniref:Uncharacterized protein n=1 Tax=Vespula squamosa TaxID=30214 RepID=A0ABD2AYN2_VESSQ